MGLFKSLLKFGMEVERIEAAKAKKAAKAEKEARAKAEFAARMRAEAKEQGDRHLKIVKESAALVNETTNPEVFFSRYNLVLEHLEPLVGLECTGIYDNSPELPSQAFERIDALFPTATNRFIDRALEAAQKRADSLKTEKGKKAALQRFFDNMDKYISYMDEESVVYFDELKEKHCPKAN